MKLTFKDKKVLVLGLGDTGLSALRWLDRQGALLSVADTRQNPPGIEKVRAEFPQVKAYLGAFAQKVFDEAELIVISPGVPLAEPAVQTAIRRGVPVVGDVELFAQNRASHAKVIAITGANGKTTVTSLVGEMCKAAGLKTTVAGNIGLPVLDVLREEMVSGNAPDVYVLELSSFQLETTNTLNADAAVMLNLSEDHMDRYASMSEYAAAKARIFQGNGVQVLNREDVYSREMALPGRRQITFGMGLPTAPEDFGLKREQGATWLMQGEIALMKTSEMHIAGLHNAQNALAALALCRAIGLEFSPLLEALRTFRGLPHRVEWVADIGHISFYDDSKGTNVGATCAALEGLGNAGGRIVLIAGGDGKGQDFSPLAEPVKKNVRTVVLIGRDAPLLAGVVGGTGIPFVHAQNLQEAVHIGFNAAHPGDIILLSPACASFDMFRNYVHRAEVFVAEVNALKSVAGRAAG